jgi:hypothetical protein
MHNLGLSMQAQYSMVNKISETTTGQTDTVKIAPILKTTNAYIISANQKVSSTQNDIKTTSGSFFYPVWDETGTNIYFNNANKPALYKMTNLGSIIDTAKDIKSRVFVKDSLIVFIENYNNATDFMLKNIKQNSIKKIFTFSFDEDIIYDFFLNTNNSSLFLFGGKGLYKLNMQDNSIKKVISNCDKELFIDFSMSYLSNKLLATKITTKVLSNTALYNQYDIYEFDENLSNPVLINTQ